MRSDLRKLYEPESIAVVGATSSEGKPGRIVLEALRAKARSHATGDRASASGFRLYGVHPTHSEVLGVPAYPSIDALPETVDLVVVAIAAQPSVGAVEAAARRGVPFVVVLAGGFGETGAGGRALEDRLRAAIAGSPTRLLGPNTVGLQIPDSGVDTVFVTHATDELGTGGVALISQSGSVAVEALGAAAIHGFPLRAFVGLGNAVDLGTVDFVDSFARDDRTTCICVYVEHLAEGRRLLAAASEAARRVPVFFLKAGRTAAGAAAVASHTGRLAGSDRVVNAALAQYSIGRVTDDEQLIDAARAVAYAKIPTGNRVAILTPAGGFGVMGSDFIEGELGGGVLELAELSDRTRRSLEAIGLPFASFHNPVDLTAGVTGSGFADAADVLLDAPEVDILIVMAFMAPAGMTDDVVERIARSAERSPTPLLVLCRAGVNTDDYCRAFTRAGVAVFDSLPRAIRAARFLVERAAFVARARAGSAGPADSAATGIGSPSDPSPASRWITELGATGAQPTEADAKELLRRYGLATPAGVVITPDTTRSAPVEPTLLHGVSAPYAVKVVSPRLLHKTEAGAVRLNVDTADLDGVLRSLWKVFPDDAILVESMERPATVELIAGAYVDPNLGPAVMVGAGGVIAELTDDVAFRLVPCSRTEIDAMIDELRIAPLLRGFRGIDVDRDALCDWVSALAQIIPDLGDRLAELDVNPLCYADGRWVALDAKIVLTDRG
ncbi:MAG: CoA-binding protein [Spirochaetaceae bacterium]|nr:MAG: CoA-binding protein [Spirochaetaceae bacterium]